MKDGTIKMEVVLNYYDGYITVQLINPETKEIEQEYDAIL